MAFAPDMAGAVARRPDMGIACARILVHHNAVLAGKTGMGGKLVAVDAINDGRAHMLGRRRIAADLPERAAKPA